LLKGLEMKKIYKLPPCPFCGNNVSIVQHRDEYYGNKKTHVSISCDTCDLVMVAKNEKIITKRWFNRHIIKEHYDAIVSHNSPNEELKSEMKERGEG